MSLSQVYDEEGRLIYLNKVCREKLLYDGKACPSLSDILPAADLPSFRERLCHVLRTEGHPTSAIFSLRMQSKKGREIFVKGRLSFLAWQGKGYVRGDFLDVTRLEKLMHIQKICYSIMNFSAAQKHEERPQEAMTLLYRKVSKEFMEAFAIENFSVTYAGGNALNLPGFASYFDSALTREEKEDRERLSGVLAAEVLERGESLIVFPKGAEKIVDSRNIRVEKLPHTWIGSEIGLPEERVRGVVSFSSYDPEVRYDTRDLEIMRYLGQQIATVLERNVRNNHVAYQRALLLSIFESSSHLIWFLDAAGALVSFNENFAKTGMRYYGVAFKKSTKLASGKWPHPMRALFHRHYKRAFAGAPIHFECVLEAQQQDKRWIEVFLNPIRRIGAPHEIAEVSAIAHDITDNKRARELAEHSLRVKENFLANMSHEIRTPINGILGMIELLENTKLRTKQRDFIDVVKKSSETLLRILNDILQLSKIEAGKLEFRRKSTSLPGLFDKLKGLFSYQLEQRGMVMDLRLASDLPEVIAADETRLLQILSNLVANAIKFSRDSGRIFVSMYKDAESAKQLTLRVKIKDSGIGIAEADIGYLFENFSQVEASRHKRFGGTGLGLAISKKLAEGMQGTMGVFSTYQRGSTFWFTFQADKTEDTAAGLDDAPRSYDLRGQLDPFCPLVLIVDDNEINCKILDRMLRLAGAETLVATHHDAAVEKAKAHVERIDCVLMDIQMPGKDGFETASSLRALSERFLPIVAVTAYSMEEDREQFLSKGMDDYLAKPVRARDLIAAVVRCCGHKDA